MSLQKKKPFIKGNRRVVRDTRINHEITEPKVRLITESGAVEMPTSEAIAKAQEAGVDLVEIAKGQDVPIVRIIDYGKYKFEKTKRDKENKKKQKTSQTKEVKLGPKTDTGDFERKIKEAAGFLAEGDSVKVSIRFKGREMAHTDIGLDKLRVFIQKLDDVAQVEQEPQLQGRVMAMVLRPKGKKAATPKPSSNTPQPTEN